MKTTSFEILEKSALPTAQAHAILKVMELEMTSAQDTLATKNDILMLRNDFQELRAATKNDILMLRNDFHELRAATKNDILGLQVEMKGIESGLTRWVLTCILGQTAVLAGLGYFFIGHLGR